MKIKHALAFAAWAGTSILCGQGLTPARIVNPSPDSWPTYHGDYSGRHYSALGQINQSNVKSLTLAWVSRLSATTRGAIMGGEGAAPAPGG